MSEQKPVAGFTPGTKGAKAFGCVLGVLVALFVVVLAVGIWWSVTSSAPAPAARSPLIAPEMIARVSAEQAVRGVMNDPASYSYVNHTVHSVEIAQGLNGYRVDLVFRGRNAFGGMVVNTATVTTDDSGLHVLSVE
jgi:hypothetical protein